jgi:hypothetical protein
MLKSGGVSYIAEEERKERVNEEIMNEKKVRGKARMKE